MDIFNLRLCCPECGSIAWKILSNGKYLCNDCIEDFSLEEMSAKACECSSSRSKHWKVTSRKELRDKAYGRYQLDWMISHGHTLDEIFQAAPKWVADFDPDDPDTLFKAWFEESGFHGDLYVCKEEFLHSEYLNPEYMRTLLSDDEFVSYQKMEK